MEVAVIHELRTPNEGMNQRNPKICADVADTHYLFTIMDTQKKGTFKFCFPGLLGIHRNPK